MSRLPIKPITLAYFALGIICIVWGTTYTAIKIAIRDFPPFLLVGLRQTSAGIFMLALAWMQGHFSLRRSDPRNKVLTPRYIGLLSLTGLSMITGGNGFVTWAMLYVPSGLAAVIGSMTPAFVLIINYFWHKRGERFHPATFMGVALGCLGLGIIFNDGWAAFLNPAYRWGILGCFGSCMTWSLGTVMSKRFNSNAVSPLLNAGIQITAGGIGGFVLSLFFDQNKVVHHTTEGWWAIVYLAAIGSALAFSLYMFVLKHLSATMSSIYTYINPMVAISLGWLLFSEPVTGAATVGVFITLTGVLLINRGG